MTSRATKAEVSRRSFCATRQTWGWLWQGRLNWVLWRLAPDHRNLGNWGEWLALLHLRRLGWDVLTRNWAVKQGELDLVAFDQKVLVFLEVKTKSGVGRPEENFSSDKQRRLEGLAHLFMSRYELHGTEYRCDLIAIKTSDFRAFELRHWFL